jgi:triosephosphate isomerase
MKIIAANWKLNKTNKEAKAFFAEYARLVRKNNNQVIICAPFTTLATTAKLGKELGFAAGAQNFYPAKSGTFTGEISLDMLAETGARVVLAGHSERRTLFRESDEFINEKVKMALTAGFKVILCAGETLEEREAGKTQTVLKRQITRALRDVPTYNNLIIAYEPVWAISGGDPTKPKPIPTVREIQEIHTYIKTLADVPVLYGGSANDKNCEEVFAIPNVDGALIGGASLVPEKFLVMVNYKKGS